MSRDFALDSRILLFFLGKVTVGSKSGDFTATAVVNILCFQSTESTLAEFSQSRVFNRN